MLRLLRDTVIKHMAITKIKPGVFIAEINGNLLHMIQLVEEMHFYCDDQLYNRGHIGQIQHDKYDNINLC